MDIFIQQFMHVYFWAFIAVNIGAVIHSVYLKSKGRKYKEPGVTETIIAITLFIISIGY